MKTPDEDLDNLLRNAAADPRRGSWIRDAARGMEARVLQRLTQPESWAEAIFSLTSWRPLVAAVIAVVIIGAWTGSSVADVFDEDWITLQSPEEPDAGMEDLEF